MKLLIVDDEYFIRVRVRKCIEWSDFGFETILDCSDGLEAIEILDKEQIDLIVADISMPRLNGLELCAEVINRQLHTQVILLTGYDKFEYAKKAVSLDVVEYILKPVDKHEMQNAVLKALSRINSAHSLQVNTSVIADSLMKEEINTIFSIMFSDSVSAQQIQEDRLAKLGLRKDQDYYIVFSDTSGKIETDLSDGSVISGEIASGKVWIFSADTATRDSLSELFTCIKVGMSSAHCGIPSELFIAYREAKLVFCQRLLEDSVSFFSYDYYYSINDKNNIDYLMSAHDDFSKAIRKNNTELAISVFENTISSLIERQCTVFSLYLFIQNILADLQFTNTSQEQRWNTTSMFSVRALEIILSNASLDMICAQIKKLIEDRASDEVLASDSGQAIIRAVKEEVKTNYSDINLSLNTIAQKLSMNASYLSNTFSTLCGQTLGNYITKIRMEKARELIENGEMKLSEIVDAVGYSDQYYFSKRFKKYFGYSPKTVQKKS